MDYADQGLEVGAESNYDFVRRLHCGLHLTPGSYIKIYSVSVCPS